MKPFKTYVTTLVERWETMLEGYSAHVIRALEDVSND